MKLLENIKVGEHTFKNRMAMAPMTRSRANVNGTATDIMTTYYTQRAGAGLIITEAINISEQAIGSPLTPGIYNQAQVDAWKKVTKSVHDVGGVIYAQLWHTGRVAHSIDRNGKLPLAPSPIAIEGQQHFTTQGMKDYETPQTLTIAEIQQIVQDYKQAGLNAIEAGFDGVELHAAFGYLPNQFLADSANKRTDKYGGSIENKNRFVLEVTRALVAALGENKVGIRLSPTTSYNNIVHNDPVKQFTHLISELNEIPLSYVHLMHNSPYFPLQDHYPDDVVSTFGKLVEHKLIMNTAYTKETGEAELEKGVADLIAYGTLFLSNPDLPKRFELNAELNEINKAAMYGGNEKGYIDYPTLEEKK